MVARKTTTTNGKTATVEPEVIETTVVMTEEKIVSVEKEHLGDVDTQTGIYHPDNTMSISVVETKESSIYTELTRIQQHLNAPKTQVNKFGKYNYRSAEDIVEAYKKVQGDTSLVVGDEIVLVGERYYIKATATLYYGDKHISTTAYAREPFDKKGMDDSQITGAASSYARKYAMNGLFCIDDNKDPDTLSPEDNTATKTTPKQTETTTKNEEDLFAEFTKLYGACGTIEELAKAWENTPANLKTKVKHLKDKRKQELTK